MFIMSVKSTLFPKELLIKAIYLPRKKIRDLKHGFVDGRQPKTYLVPFLLFKSSAVFQFPSRENRNFDNVSFFKSKCLIFLYFSNYLFL